MAWPLAAHAQQGERMRLIGVLMGWPESDARARSYLAAFRGALTKLMPQHESALESLR